MKTIKDQLESIKEPIKPLNNRETYSKLMGSGLAIYIITPHCKMQDLTSCILIKTNERIAINIVTQ